jgi:hypothetical protein
MAGFDAPRIALGTSASCDSGGTGEGHFGSGFTEAGDAAAVNTREWWRKEM